MSNWFTSPETTPTSTCPSEPFAIFASKYPKGASFLELGSGSGNNLRWLIEREYKTFGIDSAPEAYANIHDEIKEFFLKKSAALEIHRVSWDCIFDINTLCHIENPPYKAIHDALNPGGKFFSIHPASNTQVSMVGKGYTRLATFADLYEDLLVAGFKNFSVRQTINWNGDTKVIAWQIEAPK